MSGASVNVLAPNGRRQTVKCTPNTTILQIIEEVCKKQGFNPVEYDIKHHNKVLDTTATFRFSGLPNNAQLELAAALRNRIEGDITLAVNLEDGSRITDTFSPNDTLLNVLNKVCPQNALPDKHPVVIYTRREIYGIELQNCTLRSLGIPGGRAMIRVLNRDPELLRQQANVSAPLPSKPVEEKPYIRKYQPVEDKKEIAANENLKSTDTHGSSAQSEGNSCSKDSEMHEYGKGNRLGTSINDTIEIKPQKNIKNPTVDLLKLAKEKRKMSESPTKDTRKENKISVSKTAKNVSSDDESMDVDMPSVREPVVPQKSIEEEFVFCGARNGMIFSLESAQSVPSEDLPENFFELTIDDAKKILRDVKKKRNELENQQLRTSQLRKLEENKKQLRQMHRYKKAIIRVQFPDRTVIQGTFKPTETVQDVLDFIRSYLEDQNLDFYIYSTPPKSILNKDSRLLEVDCVPGALLYFGAVQDQKENFLKREFQNMFTTNSVASLAAARIRQANTRNVEDDPDDESYMDETNNGTISANYGASTSNDAASTTERKIISKTEDFPKWFRPL